ncbi:MAG: serine/threonine protein kinase, partial [Polyangiaceae bacterium]
VNAGSAELLAGDRLLDRYVILDRVGGGGMASIYRAMDERLDRVVCVKLLHLELEGSGSTSGRGVYQATYTHFQKEALALSKLRHPNTLRIYDFGYLPDTKRPFQISEFLEGGTLEEQVKFRGALPRSEVSAILERICGAVDEAHAHDIIHRDIKPSNIIFGKVGDQMLPKLADFGIAHSNLKKQRPATDDDDEPTVSTIALFSPRWAAPEQLAGGKQGPATDVYALGLTTFFMLAGHPLFEGQDVRETFTRRIKGDDLVKKLLAAKRFGPSLERALLKTMAASPDARYATPKALFEAMRDPLAGRASGRLPPPNPPPSSKPRSARELPPSQPTPSSNSALEGIQGFMSRARRVDVQEKIDLSFAGPKGDAVRFRVSVVPSRDHEIRLNIKGLNCFVRQSGRPTPAIVADRDGTAELISTAWEPLGKIGWSFGEPRMGPQGPGRAFRLSDGEMMVPSQGAQHPVAIFLGNDGDVVVMCSDR